MLRRLLVRALAQFCTDCGGLMWPRQKRCGPFHRRCKHLHDYAIWVRNDYTVVPWDCTYCGRSIAEGSHP